MERKNSYEFDEKVDVNHHVDTVNEAARKVERKLRTKIDFCVVPTVTLLYLMCFVDRSNIGMHYITLTPETQIVS
jgi:hypothetical protein